MERKMAEQVVKDLQNKKGPQLTMLEAISMTKVMTDCHEVYAIQKGDVTFLVWKCGDGSISTKVLSW